MKICKIKKNAVVRFFILFREYLVFKIIHFYSTKGDVFQYNKYRLESQK